MEVRDLADQFARQNLAGIRESATGGHTLQSIPVRWTQSRTPNNALVIGSSLLLASPYQQEIGRHQPRGAQPASLTGGPSQPTAHWSFRHTAIGALEVVLQSLCGICRAHGTGMKVQCKVPLPDLSSVLVLPDDALFDTDLCLQPAQHTLCWYQNLRWLPVQKPVHALQQT